MLLADFIKGATASLEGLYPQREAQNIILILCESRLGTRSYTHIIEPQYSIGEDDMEWLDAAVDRLAMGEPIQHIIGFQEFCGRRFTVSRDVLIPRPETELLVQEAVGRCTGRVLDLCTGSGCIAWSVALALPGTEVVAVDLSEAALAVAESQPFGHDQQERGVIAPVFVKADVLDTEQEFDHGMFSLILSNPPYIKDSERGSMRTNVLDHEPEMALFVPDEDPLVFYRAVARWSQRFLQEGGSGITEINETLGQETAQVFIDAGFRDVVVIKDLNSQDRFVRYCR